MTLLINPFESASSGTTVSSGNSGGSGGNAFDAVTIGSGAALTYDNTRAAHGSQSANVSTGTSNSSYVQWSTAMGSQGQVWFRVYLFFSATPSQNFPLIRFMQGATQCSIVRVLNNLAMNMTDSAGTTIFATTARLTVNQWNRIEGFVIGSATTGQLQLSIYSYLDNLTPVETDTSAATVNTAGNIDTTRIGVANNFANIGPFWMDDLGLSSTGPVGPVIAPVPVLSQFRLT